MKILKNHKYKIGSGIIRCGSLLLTLFIMVFSIALVNNVNADVDTNSPSSAPATTPQSAGITNPLGDGIDSLPKLIEAILNIVLVIGVPIVALAIIYSGFLFVQAQGNTEKITGAKKTLLYTIVGAALLLGAWVIANAIKGTVDDIKSTA